MMGGFTNPDWPQHVLPSTPSPSQSIVATSPQYGLSTSKSYSENTAAMNLALAEGFASGKPVFVPGGIYQIDPFDVSAEGVDIYGVKPDLRAASPFGHSVYSDASRFRGTWLKFRNTTGNSINCTPSPTKKISIKSIGLVGPGSGTSVGFYINASQRLRLNDVVIANFQTGFRNLNSYFGSYTDLLVQACDYGIYLTSCNQNTFYNTHLEVNRLNALRIDSCNVLEFIGGVTEVNNGVPILMENLSSVVVFHSWYFEDFNPGGTWPSPITYAFEIKNGCDFNAFVNCHWPGVDPQIGMIRGNHSQVLWPQGPIALDLASSSAGFYQGRFEIAPTYTVNTMANKIVDIATGTGLESLTRDLMMPVGNRIFFGPNNTYGNWLRRNAGNAQTEYNSGTYHQFNQPIYVANSAEPATPTGGGVFFVSSGSVKYKGSAGTVTTVAPA